MLNTGSLAVFHIGAAPVLTEVTKDPSGGYASNQWAPTVPTAMNICTARLGQNPAGSVERACAASV